ncbi:MAG: hypothetical protein QXT72_03405 [Candidatus Micrarchaeia archaeon]
MKEGGKMTQVQKEKFDIDKFIKDYLDQVAPNSFIEKIRLNNDIKLIRSDREGIIIEFKDESPRNKFLESLDKGYNAKKYYRFGIKINLDDLIKMYREEAEKLEQQKVIEEVKPQEIEISSIPIAEIQESTQSLEQSIKEMEKVIDKIQPEQKNKSDKLKTIKKWTKEYFEDTKTVLKFAREYLSGKYKDEVMKAEETKQKLIQLLTNKNKELTEKLMEVKKELAVEKEENKQKIAELERRQQEILAQQKYLLSLLEGGKKIGKKIKEEELEKKPTEKQVVSVSTATFSNMSQSQITKKFSKLDDIKNEIINSVDKLTNTPKDSISLPLNDFDTNFLESIPSSIKVTVNKNSIEYTIVKTQKFVILRMKKEY